MWPGRGLALASPLSKHAESGREGYDLGNLRSDLKIETLNDEPDTLSEDLPQDSQVVPEEFVVCSARSVP